MQFPALSQDTLPAYKNDDSTHQDPRPHSYGMDISQSNLSQFLSHFTLGFADGLTVPFALTAGLSSLGDIKAVIYAGMAEICAGCISMGIGGYLAAEGQVAAKPVDDDGGFDGYKLGAVGGGCDAVHSYLAPLDLPPDLVRLVTAHVESSPMVLERLQLDRDFMGDSTGGNRLLHPVLVGLSVAFGYLLGGALPLFPYFCVDKVHDGLQWSFLVCISALFVFGFVKDYLLHDDGLWRDGREGVRWEMVRQGCFEGMRMVIMGGIAAIAAALCVRLFEGVV